MRPVPAPGLGRTAVVCHSCTPREEPPTQPGSLELWTGVTWLRHLSDDPSRPDR